MTKEHKYSFCGGEEYMFVILITVNIYLTGTYKCQYLSSCTRSICVVYYTSIIPQQSFFQQRLGVLRKSFKYSKLDDQTECQYCAV